MKAKMFIILFFVTTAGMPAMPDWYDADLAGQYPGYFVGKGFSEIKAGKPAEAALKAKEEALKDAASVIFSRVSGETINRTTETGIGAGSGVEDFFLSETQVRTDLEVMGYKVLKNESDRNYAYALVGIPASDMKNAFRKKIETAMAEIKNSFKLAEALTDQNPQKAIENYKACISQSKQLEEDLKIYLFLNNWHNDFDSEINTLPSTSSAETKLTRLSGTTPKPTSALVQEIVQPFLAGKGQERSFVFYPLQYENTGFVSSFGRNFSEISANRIAEDNRWYPLSFSQYDEADFVFRGKILQMDDGVLLSVRMESKNSNMNRSSEVFVNGITCDRIGWDRIKPENLDQALRNKLALYKAIQRDNTLKVELRTDKMSAGPVIYTYGEEPEIFVRTNKSCYIRLIYIFSDNTKTLIKNNYFIATDQVNQWIRIPFDGVICEPSGVEQLILQASTEKQPPVDYHRQNLGDGYFIDIITQEISKPVGVTRGLKLKNPAKEISEQVYQWTVFEK
ncbi:hypothetical protein GF407_09990 [candidate division KSB1 bacterium]|nr:hypothetical protein [candidate division KSB1 bacterium]